MKYRVLKFSTIALLTVCLTACATDSYNSDSNSDNVSEPQQSAQSNVIEESLGTIEIDGIEFQLPCKYTDLAIQPAYDESKWLPPQESEFVDGMYDQQIGFKVNEESNQLYTLWSTYPDGESYQNGTVYSVLHSEEGVSLTYNDQVFVCGETTAEELTAKLGTQYTANDSGSIQNYTYKDGVVTAYFRDDKLNFLMIRSTAGDE